MTPVNNSLPDWLVALFASGLTAFIAWLRERNQAAKALAKAQADIDHSELENVEKAITIWRQLANEMISQVDHLKREVQELTSQVKTLHTENGTLRTQINQLHQENKKLEQKVEQMKNK